MRKTLVVLVIVFVVLVALMPVTAYAADDLPNALSFSSTRVRFYNRSEGSMSTYLQQTHASGGLSGSQAVAWGGFALTCNAGNVNFQAGGSYNIASPALITVKISIQDFNGVLDPYAGNAMLITDAPQWLSAPDTTAFPDPYAGTGLIFWSGYTCGAYKMDRLYANGWYDLTLYFAVDPPNDVNIPRQYGFTLNLSFANIALQRYEVAPQIVSYTCIDTTTAIVDALNGVSAASDKEQSAAQDQGNSSITQGEAAIPDNSATLLDGVSGFVTSLAYNGTDCAWTLPDVKIPSIDGVLQGVTLINSQPINFGTYLDALPSGILTIMRAICSIAVIFFGFKELYGTIEYVLTLRGGGGSGE